MRNQYPRSVPLSAAQKAQLDRMAQDWTQAVIAQANDESDPETQANAQALLTRRGIRWS